MQPGQAHDDTVKWIILLMTMEPMMVHKQDGDGVYDDDDEHDVDPRP